MPTTSCSLGEWVVGAVQIKELERALEQGGAAARAEGVNMTE